jgi:hypothetical protein
MQRRLDLGEFDDSPFFGRHLTKFGGRLPPPLRPLVAATSIFFLDRGRQKLEQKKRGANAPLFFTLKQRADYCRQLDPAEVPK